MNELNAKLAHDLLFVYPETSEELFLVKAHIPKTVL